MATSTFTDFSSASRKTTLSAKLVKILYQAGRGEPPSAEELETLNRGKGLLQEILQGSLLIEKKPLEAGVRADLEGYSYALRSLARQSSREAEPSTIFQTYFEELSRLSKGKDISRDRLDEMSRFFRALSDYFFRGMRGVPADRLPVGDLALGLVS